VVVVAASARRGAVAAVAIAGGGGDVAVAGGLGLDATGSGFVSIGRGSTALLLLLLRPQPISPGRYCHNAVSPFYVRGKMALRPRPPIAIFFLPPTKYVRSEPSECIRERTGAQQVASMSLWATSFFFSLCTLH
jgi:hypothetical protein